MSNFTIIFNLETTNLKDVNTFNSAIKRVVIQYQIISHKKTALT